ncbi:hypothetical protein ACSSS7_004541 [Eimeria intestinalis]
MDEGSRLELGDEVKCSEDIAGSASTSSDASSQEEDTAEVQHPEFSKESEVGPHEALKIMKQAVSTPLFGGLPVVSGTATAQAGERGEAASSGSAAGKEATQCGSSNEVRLPEEAGGRDSMECETFAELAAGEPRRPRKATDLDSPLVGLDATQATCSSASALPSESIVEATSVVHHGSASCEESGFTAGGGTSKEADESSEPSENLLSEGAPPNTESLWFSSLVPAHVLGAEQTGLATIFSTVESWVTSAFDGQEGKDKKEKVVRLEGGNEGAAAATLGSSSTWDSPRSNGPLYLTPTESKPGRIGAPARFEAEPIAQVQTPACSSTLSRTRSSPQILLHLCGQAAPILWSGRERVSQPAWAFETSDEKGLERWILDGCGAFAEAQDKADGSACSSESSEEDKAERIFDLARVRVFFLGNGEAEQTAGDGDNLDPLHRTVNALQPLHVKTSTFKASASSLTLRTHERELTTSGSRLLSNQLPSHADETIPKEAFAPTELGAQGSYILKAFPTPDKKGSPLAMPNAQTAEGVVEGDYDADDAAQSVAGSDTTADECDTLWASLDHDYTRESSGSKIIAAKGDGAQVLSGKESSTFRGDVTTGYSILHDDTSSELTTEEAEAKEASIRSLGNRIWAFFGGSTAAEGALTGSERPTSSDAVKETIQFEDPAVVQRDDHRAFPNETQLLLESIKQNSQLQGFFGVSVVRTMKVGDFFGVEELIAGEKLKCALTPRPSASECVLWVLDKELFLDSVKDMLAKREAFVPVAQSFLHMVPLVRDLPEEQIAAVAKACKVERFAEGQTVFKMGFHGDMLCFIYSGEAITQKPQDDGGLLELARQGRGEYFGEMALIRNARRTASVVAGTELLLLCLDKDSFESLLAPLKEKMWPATVEYHLVFFSVISGMSIIRYP